MNSEPPTASPTHRQNLFPTVIFVLGVLVVGLGALVVMQSLENTDLRTAQQAPPAKLVDPVQLASTLPASNRASEPKLVEPPPVIPAFTVRTEPPAAPASRPPAVHIPTTPAPTQFAVTNAFGGVSVRKTFATLMGATSQPLAKNAEFSRILGRRLIFSVKGAPPLAVDVDQVHPDVLHFLEIDPESAKRDQLSINMAKAAAAEKAEAARNERAKVEQERMEVARKAALGQAGNGVLTDQLVALAALRSAGPAVSAPAPQVIVIQQPQPVWSYPVIWTPVTHTRSDFRFNQPFHYTTTQTSSGSSFQFIQQRDSSDPFARGRRL